MRRFLPLILVLFVVLGLGAATQSLTVSGPTALNGGLTMDTNMFTVANDTGAVVEAGSVSQTQINIAGAGANPWDYTGTLAAMTNGDDFTLFDVNITNGNHSGTTNTVQVLDIAGVTADAETTETAINIGNGWDVGLNAGNNSITTSGGITGGALTGTSATIGGGYYSTGCTTSSAGVLQCTGGITSDATILGNVGTFTTTLNVSGLSNLNGGIAVDTSNFTVNGNSGAVAVASTIGSTQTKTSQSTENTGVSSTLATDSSYLGGSDITYSGGIGSSAVKAVTTYTGSNGAVTNIYSSVTTTNTMSVAGAGVMAVKGVSTNTGSVTDGNIYGGQFIAKHNHATNKMANEAALIGIEGWAYDSGAAPAGTVIGGNFGFHNEGTTAKDGGAVYRGVQIFADNASGAAVPSESTGLAIWNQAGVVDNAIKVVVSGSGFTNDIVLQNGETITNVPNGTIALGGAVSATGNAALDGGISVDTSNFTVNGTSGAVATASTVTAAGDVTATTDPTGGNSGAKTEFIGLPRIKLASLGTGTNGVTETVLYTADADPAGAWVAISTTVTLSNNTTYKRVGANSLKLAFGETAAIDDGATTDIANDDLEANESIGFWMMSDATLVGTDVKLLIDDTDTDTVFSTCATVPNIWAWCEVDISSLAAGTGNVVDKVGFVLKADKPAFNLYIDGMYKWDAADEDSLGVDVPYDGVLSVVGLLTAETQPNTTADLVEHTGYFVSYSGSPDVVVWITDQSARSNIALVAYQ